MKRNFVLVCASALVLALGLGNAASAQASATAAKPGAKKGKTCPGKAGGSATARSGKKAKGCAKGATLREGIYEDATQSLRLIVSGTGKAILEYSLPSFCETPVNYHSKLVSLSGSGDSWKASENRYFNLFGEPATAQWNLAVKKSGLDYALNFKLEGKAPVGPCEGQGHPRGTLTKVG